MTHSKGPWKARQKSEEIGDNIVISDDKEIVAYCPIAFPFANARLMAAAPELLKACAEAFKYLRGEPEWDDHIKIFNILETAILQAMGLNEI